MNKLRYVCLEGGGGRGTVYLGVVKALKDKGVLPVPRISLEPERTPGSMNGDPKELRKDHQILGVSGASAGAITSFLIALGCGPREIADVIERQIDVPGNEKKMGYFDSFLDPGLAYLSPNSRNRKAAANRQFNKLRADLKEIYFRTVDEDEFTERLKVGLGSEIAGSKVVPIEENKIPTGEFESKSRKNWQQGSRRLLGTIVFSSHLPLWKKIEGLISDKDPLLDRLSNSPREFRVFARNLVQGEGIFTGLGCRACFRDLMNEYFVDIYREDMEIQRKKDPTLYPFLDLPTIDQGMYVTFKDFYHVTGIDFRVTGVNLSKAEPAYFSVIHTPNFPVIEAVSISMCIPGAFKPIIVSGFEREGRWVDGGALINYPLHAFDNISVNKGNMPYREIYRKGYDSSKYDSIPLTVSQVNSDILGFRLKQYFPENTPEMVQIYWKHRVELRQNARYPQRFNKKDETLYGLRLLELAMGKNSLLSSDERNRLSSVQDDLETYLTRLENASLNSPTVDQKRKLGEKEMNFGNLLGDIFSVFMYSGGVGQIRSKSDEDQTLLLPDFHISTLDFTPERYPNKVLDAIDDNLKSGNVHPIVHAYGITIDRLTRLGF